MGIELKEKDTIKKQEPFDTESERVKDFLLLLVTMMLCLIVGEFVARAFVPAPLQWLWPQTIYESNPSIGFLLKPNQSAYTADKAFQTNSMGIRGPERNWQKPLGVQRILILGDSIAFGYGVRYEDTFADRLEKLLNQSKNQHRYEVINAGVPSFNTLQEVTYFQEKGIYFEPDLVVLALYWNDIHSKIGIKVDSFGRLIEASDKQKSDFLDSSTGYFLRNWLKRSRLLYFIVDRLRLLFTSGRIRETQMAILQGITHPLVEKGWDEVDRQLAQLAALCRSRQIKLLGLILPMPQQLDQLYPNIKYQSVIQTFCKKHDIYCLDLLPVFERHYTTHTSLFISYDGDHPNERGHALIAQELYQTISNLLP